MERCHEACRQGGGSVHDGEVWSSPRPPTEPYRNETSEDFSVVHLRAGGFNDFLRAASPGNILPGIENM